MTIDSSLITNNIMGYANVSPGSYNSVRKVVCEAFHFSPHFLVNNDSFTVAYTSPLVEKIDEAAFVFFGDVHTCTEAKSINAKVIEKFGKEKDSLLLIESGEDRIETGRPTQDPRRSIWLKQILHISPTIAASLYGWDDPKSLASQGTAHGIDMLVTIEKIKSLKEEGQLVPSELNAGLNEKISTVMKLKEDKQGLHNEIVQRNQALVASIQTAAIKKEKGEISGKVIFVAGLMHVVEVVPHYSTADFYKTLEKISAVVLYPTVLDTRYQDELLKYQKEMTQEIAKYAKK